MTEILNKEVNYQKQLLKEIASDIQILCQDIENKELTKTLIEVIKRIDEPFMFVVVGEVKAGKSSFVNALLNTQEEICKVAPSPMTDTIQLITYGEYREEKLSPTFKKIYFPEDILKEIAIVDTPGTNTIIDYHQEITEGFIPSSDLVIFVFEAKNPYRQSSWELFDFINSEWHKKIIFVLQQKDLMTGADLQVNVHGLREHALKKGIEKPTIFAVSAKQELEEEKENSGFADIRKYIQENITGGLAPILKLENNVMAFRHIFNKLKSGIDLRQEQLIADRNFRQDIKGSINKESLHTENKVQIFIENLLLAYDKTTREIEKELENQLSVGKIIIQSLSSIFNKNSSLKNQMNSLSRRLEEKLELTMQSKIEQGVHDITDSINQLLEIVDLKIKNSQTILKNDHELFSSIAERRSSILIELRESFNKLKESSSAWKNHPSLKKNNQISAGIMQGGGLAIIGVIVASVTQVTIFDVTGGILTAAGLIFAGVTTGFKRKKILREYRDLVKRGRLRLEKETTVSLNEFLKMLVHKIDSLFTNFDELLKVESKQIKDLKRKEKDIDDNMLKIEKYLKILEKS